MAKVTDFKLDHLFGEEFNDAINSPRYSVRHWPNETDRVQAMLNGKCWTVEWKYDGVDCIQHYVHICDLLADMGEKHWEPVSFATMFKHAMIDTLGDLDVFWFGKERRPFDANALPLKFEPMATSMFDYYRKLKDSLGGMGEMPKLPKAKGEDFETFLRGGESLSREAANAITDYYRKPPSFTGWKWYLEEMVSVSLVNPTIKEVKMKERLKTLMSEIENDDFKNGDGELLTNSSLWHEMRQLVNSFSSAPARRIERDTAVYQEVRTRGLTYDEASRKVDQMMAKKS